MKLVVKVIEARNIPAMDLNGLSDPYVRLQMGKQRFRTKVIKKCLNPYWGDEFCFRVDDLSDELVISVLDEDKYFNDDFVGLVKIPVSKVFDAPDKSLGTCWYPLQPKSKKCKSKQCGDICLHIYLSQYSSSVELPNAPLKTPRRIDSGKGESVSLSSSSASRSSSPMRLEATSAKNDDELLSQMSDQAESFKSDLNKGVSDELTPAASFDELMKIMDGQDKGSELPSNLPGGVVLDQLYSVSSADLNSLIFSPDSKFLASLAEVQGRTELILGQWEFDNENLKRQITYLTAPSKLSKSVKAFETQTYKLVNGNSFAVLVSVSTPDVMYGSTFRVEMLYCITPGPDLPSGEQSTRLLISWGMNFVQSTMMKRMIENGARPAIKESFVQFSNLLSEHVKPVDLKGTGSQKEQVLASLQAEPLSDWKLAVQYFANFTVVSTIIIGIYVLVHICLTPPSTIQGLEFVGLDLPDSIGEVIVCSVLVLQAKRIFELVARFMQARSQKGSDHGVKAQGNGWLLTVALIEGSNLAAVDSSGFSDPYVVFTCNGKTRTSSIKFQKLDPLWNEIFEFDVMDEPPSVLELEVFDFDGPFDEATSLGHAEINFLRTNISELADVWIPLQGTVAQACQSKLRLRIFLDDTRGANAVREYLQKMEKEVGKKINQRSPQTNSAFQKLFCLPPEEFLINDFTCHLKRKMPLQGRLFLSPRVIGFHASLFRHKTKFYFLWEDIEDIQVASPNLSSMGSPTIVITLRKGRGLDAKHGARTQDEEGRLKFYFHSFVSFTQAHRTILALWKARSLSPEQKIKIVEDSETCLQTDESGTFVGDEDVSLNEVYSSSLSVPMNFLMEIFSGGVIERRVMEKTGCLNYTCSSWELEKDVYERQVCYKFDKHISRFKGEVTSTQQKSPLADKTGWLIEEVLTLHGIPLGDYFNLHLRYQIDDRSTGCFVKVSFGIAWLKSTKHQKRISKNILSNLADRLKVMFATVEKEYNGR
ncbi:C2 and GRAM domain-containing protein At1g03370-like isoform X1 [Amaranthus tricolor]|uniref:C2 and GRAM domain-containing protein At1g03370-like isoform X1 n=1 Tax=Amaranthus tricolor TaxID=29722 RepID=UPI00258D0821|nr:C2 and GRAM domain-containing protein At1g03370-like isoform X1 [Amaranthus tricolor]